MTPLGSLGCSQVTVTEVLVMEWVDTLRGAEGTPSSVITTTVVAGPSPSGFLTC